MKKGRNKEVEKVQKKYFRKVLGVDRETQGEERETKYYQKNGYSVKKWKA
jgi:hypothetical protein